MISAVIITLNEENNIARCLASLEGVADEVVVVDAGSTDRTEKICRSFGVRWVTLWWNGYGQQKNAANALAHGPYLLSLDADEVLSPELRAAILKAKPRLTGAYAMSRLSWYAGRWIRHSGWYPDTKVRLFPKGCRWSEDPVHEQLILPEGMPVSLLAGDLWHFSYRDEADHKARQARYAKLAAEALFRKGKRRQWWQRVLKPVFTWFRVLVLRSGWRDGEAGWQIARISAWGTRERYRALDRRWQEAKKPETGSGLG